MIRRPVVGPRSKEWKCCFCLHVRTATICLGIWHLMLHLVALCVLVIILHSPALLSQLEHPEGPPGAVSVTPGGALSPPPTPLVEVEHPPYGYRDHSLTYHDVDMGALVTICTLAITLMMLYGAVKQRPAHLLPFFCLQLFDFAITTLTATGYLCYLRSVHRLVAESKHVPMRDELLKLSPQTLSLFVLVAFIGVMLFKAYCIGIVWRCYKYLTMRQHALKSLLPYVIPDPQQLFANGTGGGITNHLGNSNGGGILGPDSYSSLLPDYEEAVKNQCPPPPSYQAAVASNADVVEKEATTSTVLSAENEASKPAESEFKAAGVIVKVKVDPKNEPEAV